MVSEAGVVVLLARAHADLHQICGIWRDSFKMFQPKQLQLLLVNSAFYSWDVKYHKIASGALGRAIAQQLMCFHSQFGGIKSPDCKVQVDWQSLNWSGNMPDLIPLAAFAHLTEAEWGQPTWAGEECNFEKTVPISPANIFVQDGDTHFMAELQF